MENLENSKVFFLYILAKKIKNNITNQFLLSKLAKNRNFQIRFFSVSELNAKTLVGNQAKLYEGCSDRYETFGKE